MEDVIYCEPGRIFCRAKKILLAVDGSEGSAHAATIAFEIAEMTKSKLFIMHVVPSATVEQFSRIADTDFSGVLEKYEEKGKTLLEGYKSASSEFNLDVETILEEGLPSERIVSLAKEKDVDLIVMGSRGMTRGRRAGMGSATERVILASECTVVVAK